MPGPSGPTINSINDKDIRIPRVDQRLMTLSSYLASYRLTLKQRLALTNHLEGIKDKILYRLLKKEQERLCKLEQVWTEPLQLDTFREK